MKLAEMKAKLKSLMEKQIGLRNEAKTLHATATEGGKEPSAEDLKNIQAKFDEAGRFATEISITDNLIKHEEGLALPASVTRKGNLAGELNLGGDSFDEVTRRVVANGRTRFFNCNGDSRMAVEKAHRFGVWIALHAQRDGQIPYAQERGRELGYVDSNGRPLALHQEDGMTTGSALVPQEFIPELISLKELFGSFRRNCPPVSMKSDKRSYPRRLSGNTYYWIGEGGQITTSTLALDLVTLIAKKLAAISVATRELNEDSAVALGDLLAGELAYAMSSGEDDAGWLGDGTSAYGGITGVANKLFNLASTVSQIAGVQVTTGTGSYAGAVIADWNNFIGLLPLYADTPSARIFTNRSYFFSQMQRLAVAAGGATMTETINGVQKQMFLGYPVEFVQKMPKYWAIDQNVALFGDLKQAAIMGERRGMEIAESQHATIDGNSLFVNDLIAWRITERIDINVHDVGNASATASVKQAGPIVGMFTAHT